MTDDGYVNSMASDKHMPSEMLRPDIYDELYFQIKSHLRLFQIFGVWIFGLSLLGAISFVINFFTDESWNEGNLASTPIKIILFLIICSFFCLILRLTYWIFSFPRRKAKAIKNGDFTWKIGHVTQVSNSYRESGTDPSGYRKHRVIYVDDERVEMLHSSSDVIIGDKMYVFYVEKKNLIKYAMSDKL